MKSKKQCPVCKIHKTHDCFKVDPNGYLANCCFTCSKSQGRTNGGYVPKGAYCDLKDTAGKLFKGDLKDVPEFLRSIWDDGQEEIMRELMR